MSTAEDIKAICDLAGRPEMAADLVAEGLSAEEARERVEAITGEADLHPVWASIVTDLNRRRGV